VDHVTNPPEQGVKDSPFGLLAAHLDRFASADRSCVISHAEKVTIVHNGVVCGCESGRDRPSS